MNPSRLVRTPALSLTIKMVWVPLADQLARAMILPCCSDPWCRLKRPMKWPSTQTLTKPEADDFGATYSTERPVN